MALLEIQHLTKKFGGITANHDISLTIEDQELIGLIGPNGSGKTTLFNCIAGYYEPDSGTIRFRDIDITGLKPHQVTVLGIARTFQIMKTLGGLSVLENTMIGSFCRTSNTKIARDKALDTLQAVGLVEYAEAYPEELPIAIQKRVALARALATEPELLLLDELAAGLNPKEVSDLMQLLRMIHEELGITLFVVEHVMAMVMELCDRIIVLDGGKKIVEGSPRVVAEDERVVKAYLGEDYYAEG